MSVGNEVVVKFIVRCIAGKEDVGVIGDLEICSNRRRGMVSWRERVWST